MSYSASELAISVLCFYLTFTPQALPALHSYWPLSVHIVTQFSDQLQQEGSSIFYGCSSKASNLPAGSCQNRRALIPVCPFLSLYFNWLWSWMESFVWFNTVRRKCMCISLSFWINFCPGSKSGLWRHLTSAKPGKRKTGVESGKYP